ncbi:hypothetical protein [Streptomyces sp. NPDC059712]|uniref:hypothetical protein n=1 Tax=Streptomyces sp. NPDC059712 TaxID=3346919 RepID=UPI00369CDCD3
MPTPSRRSHARILTLLALVTVLLAGAFTPTAHAASPVYSGPGWKALTKDSIYSLSPDPYTVVFANTTARTRLAKYFKTPAIQVTRTVGVPITVTSTIDTTPAGTCPTYHRIVVHYTHQPLGQRGMSSAWPCYRISDGSAWGGHLYMDSEYWEQPAWFSTNRTVNEAWRRDISTHELGHMLGLDHPNTDVDRDGKVEAQECVRGAGGLKPIMCSPNRGLKVPTGPTGTRVPVAYNAMTAGSFTKAFDLPGLRQMLANYRLRQN